MNKIFGLSKKNFLILFAIVFLAAFIRFYKLNLIPPGVNRDEASIGYTAYSLIKTGKDEYGRILPLSFQSFGDWKLPLYIYLTVPFVKLFGMNEWAVRLPSAIAGIITVVITYFLVIELFIKSTQRYKLSALTSIFLAINPWHIHLSRVESESNVAVLLISFGTLLFLKAVRHKPRFFIPSFILFALSYYTYHGNHIFTTLFIAGLAVIYKKQLIINKHAKTGTVIFLILTGIILSKTLHHADRTKLAGISIFSDPMAVHENIELPRSEHISTQLNTSRLIHNRVIYAVEKFAQNYIKSFAPEFLFIKGGENRAHNIGNFGNMYIVESFFFYAGIAYFLINKKGKNEKLLLWWLAISPIASSITKDAPHTNRMFAIFPLPPLMTTVGIFWALSQIKNNIKNIAVIILILAYCANIAFYFDRYFYHFPRNESKFWGIGYKKLTEYLNSPEYATKNVIISHPEYSPYIFLLFYSAYDPEKYIKESVRYPATEDGFLHVQKFGRFTFREIYWDKDTQQRDTLLVDYIPANSVHKYPNIQSATTIKLPNNENFVTIAHTMPL